MEMRAYFKHIDSSLPLYAYAEKKLGSLCSRYLLNPIEAHLTFFLEGGRHCVSCKVADGGGYFIQVDSEDDTNFFSCIDQLKDRLDESLRRQKERRQFRKMPQEWLAHAQSGDEPPNFGDEETAGEEAVDAAYVINFEKARRRIEAARHRHF